jgi:hypothetical protein
MATWDPEDDPPYNYTPDHRLTATQEAEARLGGLRRCVKADDVRGYRHICDRAAFFTTITDKSSKRYGVSYVRCDKHGCLLWWEHTVG